MIPRVQISGEAGRMDNYSNAVRHAGGVAVWGYCPSPDLSCDGLLLCGGGDPDPALFGQANSGSNPPDPARDAAELALLQAFWTAGKPILGVCRGMQMLNIFLGGTLIQDLPAQVKPFHAQAEGDAVHPVRFAEQSLLFSLYGPKGAVNSAHHQGLGALGEGLRLTAWSESGVPEGVEHSARWALGVQFHPERMAWDNRRADAIDGAPILRRFLTQCGK